MRDAVRETLQYFSTIAWLSIAPCASAQVLKRANGSPTGGYPTSHPEASSAVKQLAAALSHGRITPIAIDPQTA
jgi:hypothetical protein